MRLKPVVVVAHLASNSADRLVLKSIPCSNCQMQSEQIFCEHCHYLNNRMDSIHFLDMISHGKWYIEKEICNSRYLALSKQLHPDLFHHKSERDKLLSEQYFQLLNKAYFFHNNTAAMLRYLLKNYDISFLEHDIPSELIDEIFEIQELLNKQNLAEFEYSLLNEKKMLFKKSLEQYHHQMETIMKERDQDILDDMTALNRLKLIVASYNYVERLQKQIDDKLFEMDL